MAKPSNILLADDDPDFVMLLRTAFECAGVHSGITSVADGAEVVKYLNGEGQYADRVHYCAPDLIILDLRLPRMNGFEVLGWIRRTPRWAHLPVIILTGSEIPFQTEEALGRGASAFVIKPFDFLTLTKVAGHLAESWLPDHCNHTGVGVITPLVADKRYREIL